MTRRSLLQRGVSTGAVLMTPAFLAACGGSDEPASSSRGSMTGTISMMNYPGWMGEKQVARFEKANPGLKVKQVTGLTDGNAAAAAQINRNAGAYDMSLANVALAEQLEAGGMIERVDLDRIEGSDRIAPKFRDAYPYGIATDLGKVGIGVRTDKVKEKIRSWQDLWDLAPEYSGQIDIVKFDADVLGMALLKEGYSVNSEDPEELEQAKKALLELKPHVRSFRSTDIIKGLIEGTAAITVTYDYDVAAAQQEADVEWVAPEEGLPAYLDGWVALAGTDKLAAVEAFMADLLTPRQYADFINTLGVAYTVPSAGPDIDPAIRDNPALRFDDKTLERVEFEGYAGEATPLRARIWEEVQAA